MSPEPLRNLREAGRVASAARNRGAAEIVAGAGVRDVCELVEDEIRRHGAELAFPVQSSRNHVAAHYCPSPEDDTVYEDGDLAKLDVGVHVDGWVVDTAVTVSVGDRPRNRPLVEAAERALEAGIASARAGVDIRDVSAVIQRTLFSLGARPMRSLCGHGVGRWAVHCPPPIPNAPEASSDRFALDAVVAVEPFATDGLGLVKEEGPPQVFRLPPDARAEGVDPGVLGAIREFRGLPFARRQLREFPRGTVEETLSRLRACGVLHAYAPLVEGSGARVAQAEHTVLLRADGAEVLTR